MLTNILIIVICLVIGFVIGSLLRPAQSKDGYLIVDMSNPNKDLYSLEIYTPFEEIKNKKSIKLIVKRKSFPSRK